MIENPEREMERLEREAQFKKWTQPFRWSGRTGAASELVVCVDLIRQGWDVFRAVSPQSVCDLVALKGPLSIRVEVRTAHAGGKKLTAARHGHYDVLAIVRGWEIVYSPTLPIFEE